MSTETLRVISKGSSNTIVKKAGMTVADVRAELGIPEHLQAASNGQTLANSDLVGNMDRISFTRGSDNNADTASMSTDSLMAKVKSSLAQAKVANGVYLKSCNPDKKVDCQAELRNALATGEPMDAETAIVILKNLTNSVSDVMPELVLRAGNDEKLAKELVKAGAEMAKYVGREGAYTQV